MRLICTCGFFRDIAPYTTNGEVPFTCASCVAESKESGSRSQDREREATTEAHDRKKSWERRPAATGIHGVKTEK